MVRVAELFFEGNQHVPKKPEKNGQCALGLRGLATGFTVTLCHSRVSLWRLQSLMSRILP